MATSLGKPSISLPVSPLAAKDLQVIVDNIRKRLASVDSAIVTLQSTTVTTTTAAADLSSIRKDIVNLQDQIDALAEIVAGFEAAGLSEDPRTEQQAGELMELRESLDSQAADPGRLPQVEAALHALQDQVKSLNLGVLL